MKTVFTGGNMLRKVYTDDTVRRITALSGGDVLFPDTLPHDTEVIFSTWGMPSLSADFIDKNLPSLKYVFYGAGSVQSFARPLLEKGVRVFSAWQANGVPVAEFTVSQIVLCGKRYFDLFTGANGKPRGNYGLKVGVIGLGTIGKLVCTMLKQYDFDVYAYDKFLPDSEFEPLGARRADLETIFGECDVITNHLANNSATKGILGKELLGPMKPDAYFINTGRGAQVDQKALINVLEASPERTALLDVTDPEPLPEGHRLRTLKNAIISPHVAGSLGSETARMGEYMCSEYERLLSGEKPLYEVTLEMLEVMA